jgi:hypothetical protein
LINKRERQSFEDIFERFNQINFNIDSKPWQYVVWNPIEKKMIMNSDSVTQLLLTFLYSNNILEPRELQKLREGYASKTSNENDLDKVLNDIK